MARIYISSTYLDLKDHRTAVASVIKDLHHQPIGMEDYPASDERPLDKCRKDVASCDAILCIVAWRYGFVPPDNNPGKRSISELEYEEASRVAGRIKRLVFLTDESALWNPSMVDKHPPDSERVSRFRATLKERHTTTVKGFASIDELCRQVRAAVETYFGAAQLYPPTLPFRPDRGEQKRVIARTCNPGGQKVHCFLLHGDEFNGQDERLKRHHLTPSAAGQWSFLDRPGASTHH
ncbi:MAG: DUF4062 domain-containing protein [Bryobacteraceae bacterium]